MIVAVLCTGPSLTQADVDYCRGRCKVVAVSDAIFLAPWADALVSHDRKWWDAHPEVTFEGPKFTHHPDGIKDRGVQELRPSGGNSGTLGLKVAMQMGATKILLLGCDLHGTHFFGPHKHGLHNTRPDQFQTMANQFAHMRRLPVINCTPGTGLKCFPLGDLRSQLDENDVLQRAAG